VETDPRYFRPTEVDDLRADIAKARKLLGWEPKVRFEELVKVMVDCDMELLGLSSRGEGKRRIRVYGEDPLRGRAEKNRRLVSIQHKSNITSDGG